MFIRGRFIREYDEGRGREGAIGGESCWFLETPFGGLARAGVLTDYVGLDQKWRALDLLCGSGSKCGAGQFCREGKSDEFRKQRGIPFDLCEVCCTGYFGGRWFCVSSGSSTETTGQVSDNLRHHVEGAGPKRLYAAEELQVGTLGRSFESDWPGLVWDCVRFACGVSSCGDSRARQKMVAIHVGWESVSFCVNAIWAAAFAVFFHEACQRVYQDLATWLYYCWLCTCDLLLSGSSKWRDYCGLCRRLLLVCKDKGIGFANSGRDCGTFNEEDGLDSGTRQGDVGTGAILEFFGLASRCCEWIGVNPAREVGKIFEEYRLCVDPSVCFGERVSKCGREGGVSYASLCASLNPSAHVLCLNKQVYRWKPRLVGACGDFRRDQSGFEVAENSFGEESGSVCLAPSVSDSVSYGCLYGDWLGRDFEDWQQDFESARDVESGASTIKYPYVGDAGSEVGDAGVCVASQRGQFSNYNRQSNLLAYVAQGLQNSRAEQSREGNTGSGDGARRSDGGRALDSVGTKHNPRRFVPIGGRERLDGAPTGLGGNSRDVAPTHRRQVRRRVEREITPLQLAIRSSLLGKRKRTVASVATRRVVVRLPTTGNGRASSQFGGSAENASSYRHSRMASPTMVAKAKTDGGDLASLGIGSGNLSGRTFGTRGTTQERSVDFLGSGGGRRAKLVNLSAEQLSLSKSKYVASAIEPITLRQYESQVVHYESFCSARKLQAYPMDMGVVEDCTVALMYSGFPSIAVNVWSAICYFQQQKGFAKLSKSPILKALHIKAEKMTALAAKKPRDAIPLTAVREFCSSPMAKTKKGVAAAALVTVGIRALLRCNELQKLKLKHVSFRDGMLIIDLGIRKNHRQRAACIFIERSDNGHGTCPVEWMERHFLQRRRDDAEEDDFVFVSKKGKMASPAIIKSMIDLVIQDSRECRGLNIATHSMRISGAVYLMMAGHSSTEIQIMGDWKSDVFLRYLRTLGLAVKRATTGMGL